MKSDVSGVMAKWRAKTRRLTATSEVRGRDLRSNRPEPIDRRGLPCERCEQERSADGLHLCDGRMLCLECMKLVISLEAITRLPRD